MDTSPDHITPSAHMRVRSNNNNLGETNIHTYHRLQPSRNFLDSQGFDSYVKGQGLPKWSPIVCQGSGQKSALTAFFFIVRSAATTPNFLLSYFLNGKRLLFSH